MSNDPSRNSCPRCTSENVESREELDEIQGISFYVTVYRCLDCDGGDWLLDEEWAADAQEALDEAAKTERDNDSYDS